MNTIQHLQGMGMGSAKGWAKRRIHRVMGWVKQMMVKGWERGSERGSSSEKVKAKMIRRA